MKVLILSLFIVSSLFSNDMQRIENIVNDISELRVKYDECKTQLTLKNNNVASFKASECDCSFIDEKLQMTLSNEKNKNKLLESENKKLLLQIKELNTTIKSQNSVLKSKDSIINKLEVQQIELKKQLLKTKRKKSVVKNRATKVKVDTKVVCQEAKDTNIFPKLVKKEHNLSDVRVSEKVVEVGARAYRLAKDATIYDAINGKKITEWTIRTSFTSNVRSENWIKITGYFINKKWLPSASPMWIQAKDVIKR
jgi:chromosome segregation ATPase